MATRRCHWDYRALCRQYSVGGTRCNTRTEVSDWLPGICCDRLRERSSNPGPGHRQDTRNSNAWYGGPDFLRFRTRSPICFAKGESQEDQQVVKRVLYRKCHGRGEKSVVSVPRDFSDCGNAPYQYLALIQHVADCHAYFPLPARVLRHTCIEPCSFRH